MKRYVAILLGLLLITSIAGSKDNQTKIKTFSIFVDTHKIECDGGKLVKHKVLSNKDDTKYIVELTFHCGVEI